jgi:hypothetical protein
MENTVLILIVLFYRYDTWSAIFEKNTWQVFGKRTKRRTFGRNMEEVTGLRKEFYTPLPSCRVDFISIICNLLLFSLTPISFQSLAYFVYLQCYLSHYFILGNKFILFHIHSCFAHPISQDKRLSSLKIRITYNAKMLLKAQGT